MSSDSERCTGNGGPGAFIRLEGAGLRFRRYADSVPTLKQTLLNRVRGIRRTHAEEFWIYRDLDLHISSGEAVGIMGANGAGKSTLLKLIAGIYTPSLGRVHVRGSVVPMMELGASLHPELTGLENIGLMGALMGKSRQVMHRRAEDILAFAGLTGHAEVPVKYYSSGMQMRLAFSIATDIEPEIMLLDEVFAAGDEEFRHRAAARMQELVATAHIVVLVSHSMELICAMTRRALWIDAGRVVADGEPATVCAQYLEYGHAR